MKKNALIIFVAALLVLPICTGMARKRTSTDVRRDRQRTEQSINQTRGRIKANEEEIGRRLNKLNSLEATISLRADTIVALKGRVDSVKREIRILSDSIAFLTAHCERLQAAYGNTLRTLRTRRQGMSDLSFIFSSKTFAQAWRRIRYLQELARATNRRAAQIRRTIEEVEAAKQRLAALESVLSADLAHVQATQSAMEAERAASANIVKSLRREGRNLNRELERRQNQMAELDRELDQVIERERREAEERERREREERERREAEERRRREQAQQGGEAQPTTQAPTPQPQQPSYQSEAEADRQLTGSFASNKGKLLFPVAGRYTIVSVFGTNTHRELSKIKFNNSGIDIEVPTGTAARAVFDGVVSTIFRLDGYHNVIILRHGEYLTVYAGIDALNIKKGDKVTAGQALGTIFSDTEDENRTILHFEIRLEKQKLNPTDWVK